MGGRKGSGGSNNFNTFFFNFYSFHGVHMFIADWSGLFFIKKKRESSLKDSFLLAPIELDGMEGFPLYNLDQREKNYRRFEIWFHHEVQG